MKIRNVLIVGILLLSVSLLFAGEVKNPDKPLKKIWGFKLKLVWKVDTAENTVLAGPQRILVSGDGTVYLYDDQNNRYYIFNKEGKFVKAFGKRGEGPGEIKNFMNAFLQKDKLIVVDIDKIHYFSRDGQYLNSIKNNFYQKGPSLFLNEDEFIHYPLLLMKPDEVGKISRISLKTGKRTVLGEFSAFKGGVSRQKGHTLALIIPGLTPMMILGYDSGKFYYGTNNTYLISVMDSEGKKLDSFSLQREAKEVSTGAKREYFKNSQHPKDMLETILKSLPDEEVYFNRIEIHNKLIYVYESFFNESPPSQPLDIFSPGGKYLYRASIDAPEGCNIVMGFTAVFEISGNHLYIALEDEDGEVWLAKYQIALPK
ncbi:MAG: 6-bladed beta-propeller [bacterium]|nr:6-bladed beta-propeller [bacterium]